MLQESQKFFFSLSKLVYSFTILLGYTFHVEAWLWEDCCPGGNLTFTYGFYQTKHFWNHSGKRLPTYNHFIRHSYQLYVDYDFTDDDTVFAQGAYDHIHEEVNGRTLGFEDFKVGWSHVLYRKCCQALALQIMCIIPSGPHKSSLRYGVYGTEIDLLYSKFYEFKQRPGFYNVGIGYRAYSGFPSDQFWAYTSIGCFLWPNFYLLGDLWLNYGLGNGRKHCNDNFIVFHSNYRLLKAMLQGTFYINSHLSFSIGLDQHIWGRNVGTGGEYFSEISLYF